MDIFWAFCLGAAKRNNQYQLSSCGIGKHDKERKLWIDSREIQTHINGFCGNFKTRAKGLVGDVALC